MFPGPQKTLKRSSGPQKGIKKVFKTSSNDPSGPHNGPLRIHFHTLSYTFIHFRYTMTIYNLLFIIDYMILVLRSSGTQIFLNRSSIGPQQVVKMYSKYPQKFLKRSLNGPQKVPNRSSKGPQLVLNWSTKGPQKDPHKFINSFSTGPQLVLGYSKSPQKVHKTPQ